MQCKQFLSVRQFLGILYGPTQLSDKIPVDVLFNAPDASFRCGITDVGCSFLNNFQYFNVLLILPSIQLGLLTAASTSALLFPSEIPNLSLLDFAYVLLQSIILFVFITSQDLVVARVHLPIVSQPIWQVIYVNYEQHSIYHHPLWDRIRHQLQTRLTFSQFHTLLPVTQKFLDLPYHMILYL